MAPVIVLFTLGVGNAILAEAALSFLGFGVPPPAPTWGGMLTGSSRNYMYLAPWMALTPGICLTLVVFSINMFGDSFGKGGKSVVTTFTKFGFAGSAAGANGVAAVAMSSSCVSSRSINPSITSGSISGSSPCTFTISSPGHSRTTCQMRSVPDCAVLYPTSALAIGMIQLPAWASARGPWRSRRCRVA